MFEARFLGQVPIRGMGQAAIGPGQGFGGSPWSVETPVVPSQPPGGYTGELYAPYGQESELGCYSCPDTGKDELLTQPAADARGCKRSSRQCPGAPVMAPTGAAVMPPGGRTYARGAPFGLMGRPFLGQVQLFPTPGGTPFYGYPPGGYIANPQGGPLMSEEITSPQESDIAREQHCYQSPDGKSYAAVPMALRDAYVSAGWTAVDYANCGGLHVQPVGATSFLRGRMGQKGDAGGGGGVAPPASGPGAPSGAAPSAGTPSPASVPASETVPSDSNFPAFPTYGNPYIYPYGYGTKQVCTKKTDKDGNEVTECHVEPSYPVVTYPTGLFWL